MCVCCACSAESDGVSACVGGVLYLPLPCGPVHSWPFTVYSLLSFLSCVNSVFDAFFVPQFAVFAFSHFLFLSPPNGKLKTENNAKKKAKARSFRSGPHTTDQRLGLSAVITTLPLPERRMWTTIQRDALRRHTSCRMHGSAVYLIKKVYAPIEIAN